MTIARSEHALSFGQRRQLIGRIAKKGHAAKHPWAGEDLSLKIDEHDQTIWNCILEL